MESRWKKRREKVPKLVKPGESQLNRMEWDARQSELFIGSLMAEELLLKNAFARGKYLNICLRKRKHSENVALLNL